MADGLEPGYLRKRASYWRERANRETNRETQTRLRRTAEILDREADQLNEREAAAKRLASRPPEGYEEHYRGRRIIARETELGWQARIEGIGALSEHQSTMLAAIGEAKRYLDDQAEPGSS
jgi:uncharacterized protein (DUF2384 family)